MEDVKLRKTGKFHVKTKLKQYKIIDAVKSIPEFEALKSNKYLLCFIGCAVMEEIKKKYLLIVNLSMIV